MQAWSEERQERVDGAVSLGPTSCFSARLIETLGSERFCSELLRVLNALCGAEHCVIYRFSPERMSSLGADSLDGSGKAHRRAGRYLTREGWRRDPGIAQIRRSRARLSVMQIGPERMPADLKIQFYPDMEDRLLVCGGRLDMIYVLSSVRAKPSGAFSPQQVARLRAAGDTLISLIAKHAELSAGRGDAALDSLEWIEHGLRRAGLPPREAQVCAGLIFGFSLGELAEWLDIGAETVRTYRRRAFKRLGVTSTQQLLVHYLRFCAPDVTSQP